MARASSTAGRGYGSPHQRARRAALAALRDGDPCARCGAPMYRGEPIDLDHTDDRQAYTGLAHRHCNRSAGATHGNRQRTGRTTLRRTRDW